MASQLDFPEGKRPCIYLPVRRWLNLFAVADFVRAAADKPIDISIARDVENRADPHGQKLGGQGSPDGAGSCPYRHKRC